MATNLSADRLTITRSGHETRTFSASMKAGAVCYQGGMVFATAGYAHGGTPVAGDAYLGLAEVSVDNTSGSNGSATVQIRRGAVKWDNAGANAIAQANLGQLAYAVSDHEVATTGVLSVGIIDEIDADGGIWVFDSAAPPASLSPSGYSDTVLTASPGVTLPAPVGPVTTYDLETTGTVVGVVPNGSFAGQIVYFTQTVAAMSPLGTVTGAFETLPGVAEGTLNLGTATGMIVGCVWTGTKYRQFTALGGTGSSFST